MLQTIEMIPILVALAMGIIFWLSTQHQTVSGFDARRSGALAPIALRLDRDLFARPTPRTVEEREIVRNVLTLPDRGWRRSTFYCSS